MSTPIERIQGYACEVNEEHWRELVIMRNGDCKVISRNIVNGIYGYAHFFDEEKTIVLSGLLKMVTPPQVIPYPEFLAKLKGEEKWEPKNGEEVEISNDNFTTSVKGLYVGKDDVCKNYVIRIFDSYEYVGKAHVRPYVRQVPTITRAEAEQKLKELGVNARIVD